MSRIGLNVLVANRFMEQVQPRLRELADASGELVLLATVEDSGPQWIPYMNDADPNGPDAIEYFLWIVRNADHTFVVDTGFDQATALRYKRHSAARKPHRPAQPKLFSPAGDGAASVLPRLISAFAF